MTESGALHAGHPPLPMLLFPFHIGPALRACTPALLYDGRLGASLPGWVMGDPIDWFMKVGDRAAEVQHPLLPVFAAVQHSFELTQVQALNEMERLKPLGARIIRVLTVYPGTVKHYDEWTPVLDQYLPIIGPSLANPQLFNVAATEFMWRVWEIVLEFECGPDDVLARLSVRAERLGDPWLLLAECALNRYTMPRSGAGTYFTTHDPTMELLADLGRPMAEGLDTAEARASELSFVLFDQLISSNVPPLHPPHIEGVARLMQDKEIELERMRRKCRQVARNLVHNTPSEGSLRGGLVDALETMREEVAEIGELDRKRVSSWFASLGEDPTMWATVAGLVGSLAAPLSVAVSASLAITSFSILGASAVKEVRNRREILEKSPWSFVYYSRRLGSRSQR